MSCSSRRLVVAALLVLTSACSLDLDVIKRKTVEVIPPSRWSGLDHVGHGVDVLEKDLYYMSQGMTACDYLMAHSTERVVPDQNYFRLLEQGQAARSTLWGHFPIRMDLKGDGTSFKEQANFGGKSALMLRAMDGSIRLDNNPFFEMALMTQGSDLPNKEQFIKMAEDELSASPIRLTFLLGLKLGWSSGILNPYKQRNEIIEKRMNHAFPGVFDAESKARDMSESLPEAIIRNSVPSIERLDALPNDSKEELARKEEVLNLILKKYRRVMPLFEGQTWPSYFDDVRWSLSIAVRALGSQDLVQQSCASVLMQRALAQMLTIMGYDRPPMEERHLVPLDQFLVHPESTFFRGCVTPGSFARRGHYAKLIQNKAQSDFLGNTQDRDETLRLTDAPRTMEECTLERAKPILADVPERTHSDVPAPRGYADLRGKLSVIGAAGYYFMAFNPGASWWRTTRASEIAIPFSNFKEGTTSSGDHQNSIAALRANGGYLPSQSLALSLGFINILLPDLDAHHLVMIDADRKETKNKDRIVGVRLSEEPRTKDQGGIVVSTIESVALLTELIFKFHEALKSLDIWKRQADLWVDRHAAAEKDPYYKAMIKVDYDNFTQSLFGDKQNLLDLVDSGKDGIRHKLDSLRLAIALNLARFAKRNDGEHSCAPALQTNLDTGEEVQMGNCTPDQFETWHRAMQLVGTAYNSPLFLNDGYVPPN